LRCQLQHYELDVLRNPEFQDLPSTAALCQKLVESGKLNDYHLIDRLFLTLVLIVVSLGIYVYIFQLVQ
jgi:hypothetical protein